MRGFCVDQSFMLLAELWQIPAVRPLIQVSLPVIIRANALQGHEFRGWDTKDGVMVGQPYNADSLAPPSLSFYDLAALSVVRRVKSLEMENGTKCYHVRDSKNSLLGFRTLRDQCSPRAWTYLGRTNLALFLSQSLLSSLR
jgi:hypothetical protein